MENYTSTIDQIIADHAKVLGNKRSELIKQKLTEKGFGHLIEGIERRRFAKICSVKFDGWEYFYADNDTVGGRFIVAIKDYEFSTPTIHDGDNYSISQSISFKWQDTYEPPELKLHEVFPEGN